MKKWSLIVVAFLSGVFFAISSGDVAAQIKSLVGQKVTGEYVVVVNGNTLSEKGAIIDSKANVPARALSEALGADVKVEGKTILITTEETASNVVMLDGKYYTKYDLLNKKAGVEKSLDALPDKERGYRERYENMLKEGLTETAEKFWEADQRELKERKETLSEELRKINEALSKFE